LLCESAGFSTVANWLQNIPGPNANNQVNKKDDAHDPILHDLCALKDDEIKAHAGTAAISAPRYRSRRGGGVRGYANSGGQSAATDSDVHQPKPKFVAYKDPTRGKKGKSAAKSNHLGNKLYWLRESSACWLSPGRRVESAGVHRLVP